MDMKEGGDKAEEQKASTGEIRERVKDPEVADKDGREQVVK